MIFNKQIIFHSVLFFALLFDMLFLLCCCCWCAAIVVLRFVIVYLCKRHSYMINSWAWHEEKVHRFETKMQCEAEKVNERALAEKREEDRNNWIQIQIQLWLSLKCCVILFSVLEQNNVDDNQNAFVRMVKFNAGALSHAPRPLLPHSTHVNFADCEPFSHSFCIALHCIWLCLFVCFFIRFLLLFCYSFFVHIKLKMEV